MTFNEHIGNTFGPFDPAGWRNDLPPVWADYTHPRYRPGLAPVDTGLTPIADPTLTGPEPVTVSPLEPAEQRRARILGLLMLVALAPALVLLLAVYGLAALGHAAARLLSGHRRAVDPLALSCWSAAPSGVRTEPIRRGGAR